VDQDLIRIVIIAVGASIILVMLVWGLTKARRKQKPINFYDKEGAFDNIKPDLIIKTEDDEFDVVAVSKNDAEEEQELGQRLNPDYARDALRETESMEQSSAPQEEQDWVEEKTLPALLQFTVVAPEGLFFNGPQLLDAFDRVGLIYGTVQVFERLDNMNRVDYAVASLLDGGIFPEDNWEAYQCPGIAFFMQPREVDNALDVFNEMITTIGNMSALLQGRILDQYNEELTEETVNELAASL